MYFNKIFLNNKQDNTMNSIRIGERKKIEAKIGISHKIMDIIEKL